MLVILIRRQLFMTTNRYPVQAKIPTITVGIFLESRVRIATLLVDVRRVELLC